MAAQAAMPSLDFGHSYCRLQCSWSFPMACSLSQVSTQAQQPFDEVLRSHLHSGSEYYPSSRTVDSFVNIMSKPAVACRICVSVYGKQYMPEKHVGSSTCFCCGMERYSYSWWRLEAPRTLPASLPTSQLFGSTPSLLHKRHTRVVEHNAKVSLSEQYSREGSSGFRAAQAEASCLAICKLV